MNEEGREDWTSFKEALLNSIDKNIPSKYVSGRDMLPWLSPHLRRLIRRKNCLHAKLKKTGIARLCHNWRMIRKTSSLGLCQARYDYINDIIGDVRSNPKPFGNSSLRNERTVKYLNCLNIFRKNSDPYKCVKTKIDIKNGLRILSNYSACTKSLQNSINDYFFLKARSD